LCVDINGIKAGVILIGFL